MRAAPPVQVAIDGRIAAAGVAMLTGTAAAGCAAWVFGHALGPGGEVGALVVAAAAALVSWCRLRGGGGSLAWDGRAWHWHQDTGGVRVMVDAGTWMLLLFEPVGRGPRSWLCVAAGPSRAAWHGLRAAVYSRASTPPR